LVLDIGANYGEIALSTQYESGARVILCEPSPEITPFLRRSIASHVSSGQISLSEKLISDKKGSQSFYVDKKWSGTSSAIGPMPEASGAYRGDGSESGFLLDIGSTTIDELVGGDLGEQRLLFKIDVEGYEARVLSGMENTLQNVASFVGIIEFDKRYLENGGTQTESFFGQICALGTVVNAQSGEIVRECDFASVPKHCDLVVFKSRQNVPQLRYPNLMVCVLNY